MTIFHVIKYPISCPPTLEQLNSLPPTLFQSWAKLIGYPSWISTSRMCVMLREWLSMNSPYQHQQETQKDIQLLRKMVLEYEE